MMLVRIGTIGSTHGVNVSSSPAPKSDRITSQRLPDMSAAATRSCSGISMGGDVRHGAGESGHARHRPLSPRIRQIRDAWRAAAGDRARLEVRRRGGRAGAPGVREAGRTGARARAAAGVGQGGGQEQGHGLGDRRVAQPGVRATLVGDVDVDHAAGSAAGDGHQGRHRAVVHLHRPEVLVVLEHPLGEACFAERGAGPVRGAEPELVAIQVVTLRDVPPRLDGVGTGRRGAQHESHLGVEELVFVRFADGDAFAEAQQLREGGRGLREGRRPGRRGLRYVRGLNGRRTRHGDRGRVVAFVGMSRRHSPRIAGDERDQPRKPGEPDRSGPCRSHRPIPPVSGAHPMHHSALSTSSRAYPKHSPDPMSVAIIAGTSSHQPSSVDSACA